MKNESLVYERPEAEEVKLVVESNFLGPSMVENPNDPCPTDYVCAFECSSDN